MIVMKLIVGLGNPGTKFVGSRHNVGFDVLDSLADSWQEETKFEAILDLNDDRILLKPQTYMNNSGDAVSKVVNFYKIEPENILIIRDDIDLTLGKVRGPVLDSSSAGHKGVASIIESLGTQKFWQLKMGVGRPVVKELINTHVLEKFTVEENELAEKGLKEMSAKAEEWLKS